VFRLLLAYRDKAHMKAQNYNVGRCTVLMKSLRDCIKDFGETSTPVVVICFDDNQCGDLRLSENQIFRRRLSNCSSKSDGRIFFQVNNLRQDSWRCACLGGLHEADGLYEDDD